MTFVAICYTSNRKLINILYNFWAFVSLSPNLVLGFCSADITPGGGHHIFFSLGTWPSQSGPNLRVLCSVLKWFAFFFKKRQFSSSLSCRSIRIFSCAFICKSFPTFLSYSQQFLKGCAVVSGVGWPFRVCDVPAGGDTALYFIPSNPEACSQRFGPCPGRGSLYPRHMRGAPGWDNSSHSSEQRHLVTTSSSPCLSLAIIRYLWVKGSWSKTLPKE